MRDASGRSSKKRREVKIFSMHATDARAVIMSPRTHIHTCISKAVCAYVRESAGLIQLERTRVSLRAAPRLFRSLPHSSQSLLHHQPHRTRASCTARSSRQSSDAAAPPVSSASCIAASCIAASCSVASCAAASWRRLNEWRKQAAAAAQRYTLLLLLPL